VLYEQKSFQGETHVLDNNEYKACEFLKCTLVFRGGPLRFVQCHVSDCQFVCEGPAAQTLRFLGAIRAIYPTGREVVDRLIGSVSLG
jgi:hypothetical protein